jgi:hypothetical protein
MLFSRNGLMVRMRFCVNHIPLMDLGLNQIGSLSRWLRYLGPTS